jgi:hypothetical protein
MQFEKIAEFILRTFHTIRKNCVFTYENLTTLIIKCKEAFKYNGHR